MTPRWRLRPFDPDRISALSRASGLPPLVAQLLLNRGIDDPILARAFLEAKRGDLHDPELLPGASAAADRLVRAIRDGKKIVVYGDYDVDGVCGTSILWTCLRLAGAGNAEYYIPHRVEEGYGINGAALRKLAEETRADVVVTVDCGISAVAEAKLAKELGIELIITDHHTMGPVLPEAAVLVHPKLPGAYPFPELCGAAVAFKVAWQICKSFGDGKKASPHLRDYLIKAMNLVALATVADMVPLEGENRVFVRHGLRGLMVDESPGVKALLHVAGALSKKKLNSGTIGYQIGPRINAAGRLEDAMMAVELFTTDDAGRALEIAALLDDCNVRRRVVERAMTDEAIAMIDAWGGLGDRGAIVLGNPGWHPGVVGIVAGRIVEIYHRPTIIVAIGEAHGQGSARSIPGFDLYRAIHACSDGLLGFGGHSAAAGIKIRPADLGAFAERFDHHCRSALTEDLKRKELLIDAEVHLGTLNPSLIERIEQMEPFGIGNPRPLLMADVRVVGDPIQMGTPKAHLKLRLAQGDAVVEGVFWNKATRADEFPKGTACTVAFFPTINEWNGTRKVQLDIKEIQVRREAPAHAQIA